MFSVFSDASNTALTETQAVWSLIEESSLLQLVKMEPLKSSTRVQLTQSAVAIHSETNILDETPIKRKSKSNILTHEISKIRSQLVRPSRMSLDGSFDNVETPLNLEDKKIDFNNMDLKFLTEPVSQFDNTKAVSDSSTSLKRIDSGFNENTFYASSYYESAIKPSELTVTQSFKHVEKAALKEISNINWLRVDSGFKDENSSDNVQFYNSESSMKSANVYGFSEAKLEDKENDFDRFFLQASNKNEATMSMSELFTDDMTFSCNFSSTPSKNKPRKF